MLIQIVLNYLVFELSFRREYQKYVKGKEYVEGFEERESTEKQKGLCVCVCLCLCVNMEVYFVVVGKIYFEGSRREKDHGNITHVIQHCAALSLRVPTFKGAEIAFKLISILGKFIKVFENQYNRLGPDFEFCSESRGDNSHVDNPVFFLVLKTTK